MLDILLEIEESHFAAKQMNTARSSKCIFPPGFHLLPMINRQNENEWFSVVEWIA